MEKTKEDRNSLIKNPVPLLHTNSNLIEKHNEEMLLEIQQKSDNFKTNEKLQYNDYELQYKIKNKCSTVLNQLMDIKENEVINIQMREAAIGTSIQNEFLLLNNQLSIYQEEKINFLQEKERLGTEFQNDKVLLKEVKNEMYTIGQTIIALKEYFSDLEHNYTKNLSDLNDLRNSEYKISNTHRQLHKEFATKKAEIMKSEDLSALQNETEQLTLEIQSFTEQVKTSQNLYNEKEQAYLIMEEEYNKESQGYQESLNCYKTEENIYQELQDSLKSLEGDDLISERDEKQKEIELNLQSNKTDLQEISNKVKVLLENKKKKEKEMEKIVNEITENTGLIDETENKIRQLQTKIADYNRIINETEDENNKVILDLQYTQKGLNEIKNAIEVEKQLQEISSRELAADQEKKQNQDDIIEKHTSLKKGLKNTNNMNMNKVAEIKQLQEQLKNKLTENNNLLSTLEKETSDAEMTFKKEKEQIQQEIDEIEGKLKRNKEEHENKLSVISNEISTFNQESERVEKERQEKLEQITKQKLNELDQLKADLAVNNEKNEELQSEIYKKKRELISLKNEEEIMYKETHTMKEATINQSNDVADENKQQPNAGKSDDVYNTDSNESQLPEKTTTPPAQLKKFDRLFLKLLEDYDKEQATKKKKD